MDHAKRLAAAKGEFEALMLGDIGIVHNKVDDLTTKLDGLGGCIDKKMRDLPGVADREMKRAGAAAIEALSDQVGKIAQRVAGDAAATERHNSLLKATALVLVGVVVCGGIFGFGGYYVGVSEMRDAVSVAREAAKASESKLASVSADTAKALAENTERLRAQYLAELNKIEAASGWASTEEGKLAKKFFAPGGGGYAAAQCNSPTWEIRTVEKVKYCFPKRRDLLGGDVKLHGWVIP